MIKIKTNIHFAYCVLLGLVFYTTSVCGFETIPLKVILNTVDRGEFFLLLSKDNDVFFPIKDFRELGVIGIRPTAVIGDEPHVSLNSLSSQIQYDLDESDLALVLTVDPSLLDKTVIDVSQRKVSEKTNAFGIDTAFFNYSLTGRINQRQNTTTESGVNGVSFSTPFSTSAIETPLSSLDMPLETVISAHDVLFRTQFTYRKELEFGGYWTRGLSNFTKDTPETMGRLVVGDFAANSGELGGAGLFGGLQYSRNFGLLPNFNKTPGLTVSGILETPSKVEVFVNGLLIRSELLPAGAFELVNLPNAHGDGEAKVIIHDAFGRERRINIPYYLSSKVLKRGLHDFSYNIGIERDSLNTIAPIYHEPTVLGYHRYGVTNALTVGLRFEAQQQVGNLGPILNAILGTWGEISAAAAYSNARQKSGFSGMLRYFYTSRYFHGQLNWRRMNQFYSNISLPLAVSNNSPNSSIVEGTGSTGVSSADRLVMDRSLSVGVHGFVIGSLTANYAETLRSASGIRKKFSLAYSRRLSKRFSLLARASRIIDEEGDAPLDSFVVGVSGSFGGRTSASSNYTNDGSVRRSLSIRKNTPIGKGWGANVRFSDTEASREAGAVEADIGTQIKTKIATLTADYTRGVTSESYQAKLAGSLAFIDDSFWLTRPIRDSFALVKVGQLDNIRVYYAGDEVGRTSRGGILVPNLISYGRNTLSINAQDVPIDMSLNATRTVVSPNFRTGGVAKFEAQKFQAFSGFVYIQENQAKIPAEMAGMVFTKGPNTVDTLVGTDGEFYVENLVIGIYDVAVELGEKACHFNMTIPQSEDVLVDLGEVVCEM